MYDPSAIKANEEIVRQIVEERDQLRELQRGRYMKSDWKTRLGIYILGWIMGLGVGVQLNWFICRPH